MGLCVRACDPVWDPARRPPEAGKDAWRGSSKTGERLATVGGHRMP